MVNPIFQHIVVLLKLAFKLCLRILVFFLIALSWKAAVESENFVVGMVSQTQIKSEFFQSVLQLGWVLAKFELHSLPNVLLVQALAFAATCFQTWLGKSFLQLLELVCLVCGFLHLHQSLVCLVLHLPDHRRVHLEQLVDQDALFWGQLRIFALSVELADVAQKGLWVLLPTVSFCEQPEQSCELALELRDQAAECVLVFWV